MPESPLTAAETVYVGIALQVAVTVMLAVVIVPVLLALNVQVWPAGCVFTVTAYVALANIAVREGLRRIARERQLLACVILENQSASERPVVVTLTVNVGIALQVTATVTSAAAVPVRSGAGYMSVPRVGSEL